MHVFSFTKNLYYYQWVFEEPEIRLEVTEFYFYKLTYPSTQCAAVTIHLLLIKVPAQKGRGIPRGSRTSKAACQGHLPAEDSSPPTILDWGRLILCPHSMDKHGTTVNLKNF